MNLLNLVAPMRGVMDQINHRFNIPMQPGKYYVHLRVRMAGKNVKSVDEDGEVTWDHMGIVTQIYKVTVTP